MVAKRAEPVIETLTIVRTAEIAAPPDITFEAVLEELGPAGQMPDGRPMPMVLEPWPGGRWYRDLGDGAGHFWGHVQVIKPPTLLELCGPLFMSYPAVNHVQYRLSAEGEGTRLTLTHRGFGQIAPEVLEGAESGWGYKLERIVALAERLKKDGRPAAPTR